MKNLKIRALGGIILAAAFLTACQGSSSGGTQAAASGTDGKSDGDVRTVYVAVGASFEPYCYIDENNKPAGYDVAVLQAIDELLPQYRFEIENMELANISVALDAKKVSIGSQQFERNPEREKKYLFTNEGIANYNKRIVFKKGRTDIHSIDDLAGKKVSASQGSNTAAILEKYNAEHDNKIEIVYTNGATNDSIYDDVMNGRLDAIIQTRKVFQRLNNSFGGGYEINEDSLFSESDAYFMLVQGEEALRDDINGTIKKLKEDGTLTKISIEYTGSDYNSEE